MTHQCDFPALVERATSLCEVVFGKVGSGDPRLVQAKKGVSPCGGHPGRQCYREASSLCSTRGDLVVACVGCPRDTHEGGIPRKAVVAGASPRAWFRLYVSRGDG